MVNFSKINKRQIFVAFFVKNIKILILLQFFAFLWYPIIRIEWYIMRKIILFFFLIILIYTNDVFAANPKMVEGESIVLDGITTCVRVMVFIMHFLLKKINV